MPTPPPSDEALRDLLRRLYQVPDTPKQETLYSTKSLNTLVIAGVIGLAAFLWSGVTQQPLKNADQFSAIASQTTEIRTTVTGLKTDFAEFRSTLNTVKSQTDTNKADIDSMKKSIQDANDRLTQLERDTR